MQAIGYIEAQESLKQLRKKSFSLAVDNSKKKEQNDMRKLKYGEGSVYKREIKRKNGTIKKYWEGKATINGTRKTVTAKTQEECHIRLEALKNIFKPNFIKKYNNIYNCWLTTWLNEFKKPYLKQSSLNNIKNCINNHITNELKNMPINAIRAIDIQKCLNSIKSSRMREYTYVTINESMNDALANNYIFSNPCAGVKKPKHTKAVNRALTSKEIELLLKNAEPDLKTAIIGYLYTGCRRNELLNISKSDCDLNNMTIHIKGTKSTTSDRIIPLFAPLVPIIATGDSEKPFNCSSINHKFKNLCDNLGIEGIVIHSLRHTFASKCNEKKIPMPIVQRWLGHAQLSTTQNIYTHETDTMNAKNYGKTYGNLYGTSDPKNENSPKNE